MIQGGRSQSGIAIKLSLSPVQKVLLCFRETDMTIRRPKNSRTKVYQLLEMINFVVSICLGTDILRLHRIKI